ncbi:MAG: hypothetical protein RMN25_03385, partial [Anaerolineae bacterium]|nr:hypothetical protein [Thermoflexales bacterium]MDW8406802.1 hypothetical protein [Anaerolineae bacterium]
MPQSQRRARGSDLESEAVVDVQSGESRSISGSTWLNLGTQIGPALNNAVNTIAVSGTDVYAGGRFEDGGDNTNADRIARWDGSRWHALGSGLSSGTVYALAISGTEVYVGGSFEDAGGNPNADNVARWDGSQWRALDNGLGGFDSG